MPELDLKTHPYRLTRKPRHVMGKQTEEEFIGHFSNAECAVLTAGDRGRNGFLLNGIEISSKEINEAIYRYELRSQVSFGAPHPAILSTSHPAVLN